MNYHRNPSDERLRDMARMVRAGDAAAAEALAHELIRRGDVEGEMPGYMAGYWGRPNLTINTLPSYPIDYEWNPEGPSPGLCLVPVTTDVIYVQIGNLAPYNAGTVHERDPYETSTEISDTIDHVDPPVVESLPVNNSLSGRGGEVVRKASFRYALCPRGEPLGARRGRGKFWEALGKAALVVHPDGSVEYLGGLYGMNRGVTVEFHGRRPPRARDLEVRLRDMIEDPLADFVSDWVAEHPDSMKVAQKEISTTNISRELDILERRQQALDRAADELERQREKLRASVEGALGRLGL